MAGPDQGQGTAPVTAGEFAALMAPLGPFGGPPRIAAAVSGGADSMALALLADAWVRAHGGSLLALVVDHKLRAESAAEAAVTIARLASRGIAARLLTLNGLARGPALAERAREARYGALRAACSEAGILHLLLGHHARDQAETVLMRRLSNSGPSGLAAMPALAELPGLRLLRPLLGVALGRLRAALRAAGLDWVEDPSNADQTALRPRLRALLADADGTGSETAALCANARLAGTGRAAREEETAAVLAERARLYPEGYAVMSPGAIPPEALAALIWAVSGHAFPPPSGSVAALAAEPRAATLAGVRLMQAARLGPGWLLVREERAVGSPVKAEAGVVWDGRFRLAANGLPPDGMMVGALGAGAARLRRLSALPAVILRSLPALRRGNSLVAVPHLDYPCREDCAAIRMVFTPRRSAAGAPFVPG